MKRRSLPRQRKSRNKYGPKRASGRMMYGPTKAQPTWPDFYAKRKQS